MRDISVSAAGEKKYTPIPAGVHIAKLYGIFDVGTHFDERYEKSKHEVVFIWELPDTRIKIKDENGGAERDLPKAISKTYNLSLNEKAILRKDLVNWRGRDFTVDELKKFSLSAVLGKSCQIQIIHVVKGDKTYANIGTIMQLPKGVKHEPTENPTIMWGIGDSTDGVPKWVVEKAMQSDEWKAKDNPPSIDPPVGGSAAEEEDDVCPF